MRIKAFIITLIAVCILSGQLSADAQGSSTANQLHLTFKDLGHSDIVIQGLTADSSFWIPFQSNWLMPHAELDIHYITSPILSNLRSSLTLKINDYAVTSIQPQTDGLEHNFLVDIPAKLLSGSGITLTFSTYITTPGATCLDAHNPANWLTILSDSSISLQPVNNPKPATLSDLPNALVIQNNYGAPTPLVFVLPDQPDAITLTAAGQVAAWLGKAENVSIPIQVMSARTLNQSYLSNANLVIVGTRSNLPLLDGVAAMLPAPAKDNGYVDSNGKAVPADQAVIQVFASPWNKFNNVLLVSAGSGAGLQLAGQAFADQTTEQTLKKPVEFISKLAAKNLAAPLNVWAKPSATFTDLGEYTRTWSSEGVFDQYYFFRYPPGWLIANDSQMVLKVGYSASLNPDASSITAFINNQQVGSMRTGQGVTDLSLPLNLPPDAINGGDYGSQQAVILHLVIDNYLKTQVCTIDHPEAAWTSVLADSVMTLKHTTMTVPDLQAFPYPFVSDSGDVPVTIILPAQPNNDEFAAALQIATTLGRFSPVDFTLQIASNNDKLKDTQANSNLILLGTKDRLPLTDQFSSAMLAGLPSEDVASASKQIQAQNSGWWQEGVSPWNKDRVALIVTGNSAEGLNNAASALAKAAPPITRPGLMALVDSSGTATIILHQATASATPQATLSAPATQVATQAATANSPATQSSAATATPGK